MHFTELLQKYHINSRSKADKGFRFELLIQRYLQTDHIYALNLKKVWIWNDFPYKNQFGEQDIGIDLVGLTNENNYWAIQCKNYKQDSRIDKKGVDSFLASSSKHFHNNKGEKCFFEKRLFIATTDKWSEIAKKTVTNQNPPVEIIGLAELTNSAIDWKKISEGKSGEEARKTKKELRPHQKEAIQKVEDYFKTKDRGKLIMACGTGKTYTSLKIAENQTDENALVLFLVPSLALINQTLIEWMAESAQPIYSICVCSDPEASKIKKREDENIVNLPPNATTNSEMVFEEYKKARKRKGMTVIFSTYHSIEVVAATQKKIQKNFGEESIFDLIICDEAHRTTGAKLVGDEDSHFVKIHNNNFIRAQKRLYMTATPRLYKENVIKKAKEQDITLWSMDDEKLYGEEIHRLRFGESVEKGLLVDYKVIILRLNEKDVPAAIQKEMAEGGEINLGYMPKLIGCVNALSKQFVGEDDENIKKIDPEPMQSAIAFCDLIKNSQKITELFNGMEKVYRQKLSEEEKQKTVAISAKHIDGKMGAGERKKKLSWLKENTSKNQCRILTNVRCMSEGVDVPSLDAILFLSLRSSQVDVVQSVGRVMRKAVDKNKKYGYIIIPVFLSPGETSEKLLNKKFKVVWEILNSLRAHDERFDAMVERIELNNKLGDKLILAEGTNTSDESSIGEREIIQSIARLPLGEFKNSYFLPTLVKKVGDRRYWEQWAADVAKIATTQIEQIRAEIQKKERYKTAFDKFLKGLQKNINPSIVQEQAIEMLVQHMITQPIFDALFENYSFAKNNAISVVMQEMLDALEELKMREDYKKLQKFYDSVKKRVEGIDNASGKQKIIIELYDKFFKVAFPKMVEQLGIVYTPVEVVDFIIHSINVVIKEEFNRNIADKNVHILDPFTGTGTFITRLIQNGLIPADKLPYKYQNELHANEIVLLAYYIAAINVENAYYDACFSQKKENETPAYVPFDGIVLTDTFQLGETENSADIFSKMFIKNSKRAQKQMEAPLRIIIGNPPYSIGQKSQNDNAQNQKYKKLDKRIDETYAQASNAGLKKSLYDSYIKAFRWSTDRLDKKYGGVIAFVSNGSWLDGKSADGFRKTIEKEFSKIYVFDLRGNALLSGEQRKKEKGNVFGSGSRTPVVITILIKKPQKTAKKEKIHYYDIGDYLSREEKLEIIKDFKDISGIKEQFQKIIPNEEGDWINQRSQSFKKHIPLAPEKKYDEKTDSFFVTYSLGVVTSRDAWCYNFSKEKVAANMQKMIAFYNEQREGFFKEKRKTPNIQVNHFIDNDASKISWSHNIEKKLIKNSSLDFHSESLQQGIYRPFCRQNVYYNPIFNERVYQIPKIFPNDGVNNLVIGVNGIGSKSDFSVMMMNSIPGLSVLNATQCFPLYYYVRKEQYDRELSFAIKKMGYVEIGGSVYERKDGVSTTMLGLFRSRYLDNSISKEDIFYYVYGFLHSRDYCRVFANDLKKMLPRLFLVAGVGDFWSFSKAGRLLGDLHLGYEKYTFFPEMGIKIKEDPVSIKGDAFYRIEKMRFPKKGQREMIIYNKSVVIDGIPNRAYQYQLNGRSAIEWVMDRYQIRRNKDSGIVNDPNDWLKETKNPRYILDLLESVITISLKTVDIVEGLPRLDLEE